MIGSTERLKRWKDVKKDDVNLPVVAKSVRFGYDNSPGRYFADRVFFDSFRPIPARRLCLEPANNRVVDPWKTAKVRAFFAVVVESEYGLAIVIRQVNRPDLHSVFRLQWFTKSFRFDILKV